MPLDSDLSFAPGREGLRRLSVLLRKEMPPTFDWDFDCIFIDYDKLSAGEECGSTGCALGLAQAVWPEAREVFEDFTPPADSAASAAAALFGMPRDAVLRIFFNERAHVDEPVSALPYGNGEITPAMVADAIDAYLAELP